MRRHTEFKHCQMALKGLRINLSRPQSVCQIFAPVQTLADIIAWNKAHADRAMPIFGQETLEAADATQGLQAPAYVEALANCRRLSRAEGIDAFEAGLVVENQAMIEDRRGDFLNVRESHRRPSRQ